jgi:hypothetical protein
MTDNTMDIVFMEYNGSSIFRIIDGRSALFCDRQDAAYARKGARDAFLFSVPKVQKERIAYDTTGRVSENILL